MDQEAVNQQIVEEVQRLQRMAEKRRAKRIEKIAAQVENKRFVDFRSVRLNVPAPPAAGYTQRQWDGFETQIVEVFLENGIVSIEPKCMLDYYLGVITTNHPHLFNSASFGYVSDYQLITSDHY